MSYSNYLTARPWNRPVGVSIVSVLHLIGAALFAITAILLITTSGNDPRIAEVLARVGASPFLVLAALGILGLLSLASGIGMWNGERWGWYLGSFYYVYFIVRNVNAPLVELFVAVSADVRMNGLPLMRTDAGSHFEMQSAEQWTPVLAKQLYYKTSWQAWRLDVGPASGSRTMKLRIKSNAPPSAVVSYEAHFVPH